MKLPIGQIYSFEGDCISRVASYYDPRAAIAAARVGAAEVAREREG